MDLSHQVTSLELSKRLKELGVPQKSLFYWFVCENAIPVLAHNSAHACVVAEQHDTKATVEGLENPYAAFTVAELGELLPTEIGDLSLMIEHDFPSGWSAQYVNDRYIIPAKEWAYMANTEADSRAKLLIHLIENSHITL